MMGLRSSIPSASGRALGSAETGAKGATYWSCRFDGYLRHAYVRLVEVLDGLRGFLGRLEPDIADPPLGDHLDIGDLAVVG